MAADAADLEAVLGLAPQVPKLRREQQRSPCFGKVK